MQVKDSFTPRHNLPLQPIAFIGRTDELAQIANRISDPACRLLTLVGPGGVGKTRLALAAADQSIGSFADGVYFVPLAAVGAVESIVPAVAEAIGFSLYAGSEPSLELLHHLHSRQMLLVLDNFEHLLAGVGLVAEILEIAPHVKILATSRERLNLQAETVLSLDGLAVPLHEAEPEAVEYSAVKLFLQSAAQVWLDFPATADNLAAVVRICRQVRGMPLGILLAAAWVGVLSIQEIADEIQKSLDFLESDRRDLPERQRSLRATFDHSWNLLPEDERAAFAKLSVFRGGFTREAGQKVAGASLRTLAALVNKSLLHRTPEGRYEVHELLRQFAEERLDGLPEGSDAVRERWAGYFVEFIAEFDDRSKTKGRKAALDEAESELANLHAVWRYLVSDHKVALLEQGIGGYWNLHDTRGHHVEMLDLLISAVESLSSLAPHEFPVLARLLEEQGFFLICLGSPEKGRLLIEKALAIFRSSSDAKAVIRGLVDLVHACIRSGELADALQAAQEALTLANEIADPQEIAMILFFVSWAKYYNGEFAEAKSIAQECIALARSLGDELTEGRMWSVLALTAISLGDYAEAQTLFRQVIPTYEEWGWDWGVATASGGLGKIALILGKYRESEQHYYRRLALMKKIRQVWEVIVTLGCIAELRTAQGRPANAVELLALVRQHPSTLKTTHAEAERLLADLQTQVPSDVFSAACERGAALDLDRVVADLLNLPQPALSQSNHQQSFAEPLSGRELEVLHLLAEGLSNAEIAQKLYLSIGTVKVHTRNIYGKLGVGSRTQAVAQAHKSNLI